MSRSKKPKSAEPFDYEYALSVVDNALENLDSLVGRAVCIVMDREGEEPTMRARHLNSIHDLARLLTCNLEGLRCMVDKGGDQ